MATQRQASPFIGEDYIRTGELLPGYDQAKKSNHFADPSVQAIIKIRAGRATIGPISRHGLGKKCLSLPIKNVQPTAIESLKQAQLSEGEKLKRAKERDKETLKKAVTLVDWWIQRIRRYDAEVDQDLIFKTKYGPWVEQHRIFAHTPDRWEKPPFGGPD